MSTASIKFDYNEDIIPYNDVIRKLRHFFQIIKGYVEVPSQPRLSILAACEDPKTIAQFNFGGISYPLPQTGQMWLEAELLKNPTLPGVFCITTSYRDEPNPIPGRHYKVFPMFEFEARGTMDDLRQIEKELVEFLGFAAPVRKNYLDLAQKYEVTELQSQQELMMHQEFGPAVSLEFFPGSTQPFWNMKQNEKDSNLYNKIDMILCGMETIGSAERETNKELMRHRFETISEGQYAQLLFNHFTRERIMVELDEYLALPMFPRFGAGIGVSRLIRAMKMEGLLASQATTVA